MTFLMVPEFNARELDGSPETHDLINKNTPEGWIWHLPLVFDERSDATSCMNAYIDHILGCDQGGCRFVSEAPEMKVIKRGGSVDPHYLVVTRPPGK
jgi:hypothetical protein